MAQRKLSVRHDNYVIVLNVLFIKMALTFETYLTLVIDGLFTGLGVAVGTYIAQNRFINQLEKIENRILEKIKK